MTKHCVEWTHGETKFLLDLYETFASKVGPQKQFKNKKSMWNKIAETVNKTCKINRTGLQVENRYKRKKDAIVHNSKTERSPVEVPYEEELNKIAAMDDSVEPEVFATAKAIKIMKPTAKQTVKRQAKNFLKDTLSNILKEINNEREENRERRHREKLELLRELFGKNLKE